MNECIYAQEKRLGSMILAREKGGGGGSGLGLDSISTRSCCFVDRINRIIHDHDVDVDYTISFPLISQ